MKYLGIGLVISLVHGFLAYLISNNLYMGIGTFGVYALVFIFLITPCFKQKEKREKQRQEAYHFVNSFIISLSVSSSPEKAFSSAIEGIIDPELLSILERLGSLDINEKITYLGTYFKVSYYPMFLSIYALVQEQGGDILEMADPLLKEITSVEENNNALKKESVQRMIQYISLWFMSDLILVFLRFGLRNFYDILSSSLSYLLTSIAYFVLALISYLVYAFVYTGEKPAFRKEHYEIPSHENH